MELFICMYSKHFIKGQLSVWYIGEVWVLMNKTDTALCSHKLIEKIDSKEKSYKYLQFYKL